MSFIRYNGKVRGEIEVMQLDLKEIPEDIHLSDAEKVIYDYIVENIHDIPYMSSRELAQLTNSNATTILRLSRKFGYDNFNDFKYEIILKLRDKKLPHVELKENYNTPECIGLVSKLYESVITRTKHNISLSQFEKIINALNDCEAIDFIASNMNSDIAHYAEHVLTPIGKPIYVYENQDLQVISSMNIPENHVVILISKTGISHHVLDVAYTLCQRGICTIALTPIDQGPLSKLCTYMIKVETNEKFNQLRDVSFSISTKYVIDLFFTSLLSKNYDQTLSIYDAYLRVVGE